MPSVIGVQFTNQSKAELIESLMLAFERNELKLLNEPVLINELMAFEATRLPGGSLRYSAPEGGHDDTVIALALAWHAANTRPVQVETAPAPKWFQEWRG